MEIRIVLREYASIPRIAVVQKKEDGLVTIESNKEVAYILENNLYFKSDDTIHYENSKLDQLNTGDIITISSRGVISRLFNSNYDEATIFLNAKCNSNCLMCPNSEFERKNSDEIYEEWLEEYIELLPETIKHITITGGEPTLDLERFLKVMNLLKNRFNQAEMLLLTNGRSFSFPKILDQFLHVCPDNILVGIPVHGHNSIIHDGITQAKGSFKQTERGIKLLQKCKVDVEIRIVVTKINYQYLEEIAKYIITTFQRPKVVRFISLETRGNCAKNHEQVWIEMKESFKYIKKAILLLMNEGIDLSLYNFPLCFVEKGFWTLCKRSISPHKVRYSEECDICTVKENCCGFFNTSIALIKADVEPVTF